eukprot:1158346-Pelagomonas_calceolata.AAC.8
MASFEHLMKLGHVCGRKGGASIERKQWTATIIKETYGSISQDKKQAQKWPIGYSVSLPLRLCSHVHEALNQGQASGVFAPTLIHIHYLQEVSHTLAAEVWSKAGPPSIVAFIRDN